ncbi:hypothetical protein [Clostridium perfringens]|uniref:hypothetical protein n=1 Tax=Clostridium perfringens TaxID=1502 RepID=UPI0039EA52DC
MNKYDNILKKISNVLNNARDKVFFISEDGVENIEKDYDEELRNNLMSVNTFLEHRNTYGEYKYFRYFILERFVDSHNNLILICKHDLL